MISMTMFNYRRRFACVHLCIFFIFIDCPTIQPTSNFTASHTGPSHDKNLSAIATSAIVVTIGVLIITIIFIIVVTYHRMYWKQVQYEPGEVKRLQ